MPDARLILIINETNSNGLTAIISGLGYQVLDVLSDGKRGLERVAELRPDLVLINLQLEGEMDGIHTGGKIYSQYDIPVIYLSDRSSQLTIRRAGGTSPFGYLFDSMDEKQILATIEVALARHGMEKQVSESERWLNAVLSSITEGVIAIDKSGLVRFINSSAETLTGCKRLDVIGKSLSPVISLIDELNQQSFDLSRLIADSQNLNIQVVQQGLLIRLGLQIPVEFFISPIHKNKEHLGTVLVIRDFTERRSAILEIRKQAERAEALLNVAAQLNTRLDIESILHTVCVICKKAISGTAVSAYLLNKKQKVYVDITKIFVDGGVKDPEKHFVIQEALVVNVLSKTKPVAVLNDIQSEEFQHLPHMESIKKLDIRSIAVAGMFQNNNITGILVALSMEKPRDFSSEELDLMRGLADQASISIANAFLFEQVQASRERTQALARRLVEVQEDERRNLAHELHDQIGQMLTGLQFSVSSLAIQTPEEQKSTITATKKTVSDLIAQTREISFNLRPSMLDDMGLQPTLVWHLERYTTQTGIKVNLEYRFFNRRFKPEIETAVFRIIQEALTNAARHAEVNEVEVTLELKEDTIQVDIQDQGRGFDLEKVDQQFPVGITGMRERASAVGGFLNIYSSNGKGTHIQAILPLSGRVERRKHERDRSASR
jgi:PAS domain S-box-containing protein